VTVDKVVDASAFASVTFLDSDFLAIAARLNGATLHAPAILQFEMANVCVKKIRERSHERALIYEQYDLSFATPIQEHEVDARGVVLLAERKKLTAYDASYLWLAKHLNCELVTLDTELAAAAQAL
jgi:predicted nucleic acid-binding protein